MLLVVLVAGPTAAPASGQPGPAASCPPEIVPTAEITAGMTGTGWTVATGRTPEAFDATVLGVLPGAISPGRDMVVVELADGAEGTALTAAGGIWEGMSGSPVYDDNGRLLGALAFGFTAGPSLVGGMTPAQDLVELLTGSSPPPEGQDGVGETVYLPQGLREQIAGRTNLSPQQLREGLSRLPTPLSVSGLSADRLARVQEAADRADLPVRAYAGTSAGAGDQEPVPTEAIQPGGNFAAVLSYGDITSAGTGTATIVCDGRLVAFGHPMLWQGPTVAGASGAEAIGIVADGVSAPLKLANVAGVVGTVTDDRLAGVRADLGAGPPVVPVTATVSADGRSRTGQTDVVNERLLPDLAALHVLGNLDAVADRVGPGTAELSWTIRGETADGEPFEFSRGNRFSDAFDVAGISTGELLSQLATLAANPITEVAVTGVDVTATVDPVARRAQVVEALVAVNDGPFEAHQQVTVQPGDTLAVRVTLRPFREQPQTLDLPPIVIPPDAAGAGQLDISGGGLLTVVDPFVCVFDPAACAAQDPNIESLTALLASLSERPRNDDVIARLWLFDLGVPPPSEPAPPPPGEPAPPPGEPVPPEEPAPPAPGEPNPPPPGEPSPAPAEPVPPIVGSEGSEPAVEVKAHADQVIDGSVFIGVSVGAPG
jgi:hypothetical protein